MTLLAVAPALLFTAFLRYGKKFVFLKVLNLAKISPLQKEQMTKETLYVIMYLRLILTKKLCV